MNKLFKINKSWLTISLDKTVSSSLLECIILTAYEDKIEFIGTRYF